MSNVGGLLKLITREYNKKDVVEIRKSGIEVEIFMLEEWPDSKYLDDEIVKIKFEPNLDLRYNEELDHIGADILGTIITIDIL